MLSEEESQIATSEEAQCAEDKFAKLTVSDRCSCRSLISRLHVSNLVSLLVMPRSSRMSMASAIYFVRSLIPGDCTVEVITNGAYRQWYWSIGIGRRTHVLEGFLLYAIADPHREILLVGLQRESVILGLVLGWIETIRSVYDLVLRWIGTIRRFMIEEDQCYWKCS